MSDKNSSHVSARAIGAGFAILSIVVTSIVCTQFVAHRLAYHPSLGAPLFSKLYNPLNWWTWLTRFYDYAPETFSQSFIIFMFGVLVAILGAVLIVGLKTRSSRKHEGTHGTAAFATAEQVKDSGLLPDHGKPGEGVYCGGFDDPKTGRTEYLRHNGPEHICIIAPTGAGKGVGNVIPTMLSEPESVFILDRKGEIYAMTAGWRKKHANNIVLRFDPAQEEGSCAWNPLEEIRFNTSYQISDTQNIALMIIDDDGKGVAGNHWRTSAYDLLTGVIIHALYKARTVGRCPTLSDIAFMLSGRGDFAAEAVEPDFDDGDSRPLAGLFTEMSNVEIDDDPVSLNAQLNIQAAGQRFGETSGKELSGIISTANASLGLYKEGNVAKNTSHSDFKISDLMDHMDNGRPKPVSLYFITTPRNADRMRPLARLLITQIVQTLADRMEFDKGRSKTDHKSRLLLMLDEFSSLGRLDVFEGALAVVRGYGIKACLVVQDVQQLYKLYTNHESIISNCQVRIAYAPNKLETAEWLSKMAGDTTVIKEQISTSGNRFGMGPMKNVSRSYQESRRPLMTPDEIMRLPGAVKDKDGNILEPGEMLIFVAGQPVIRGRQILYFLDPTFSKRSQIEPPKVSDVVRKAS